MTMFVYGTSTNFPSPLAAFDQVFVGAGVTVGSNGTTLLGSGGGQYIDIQGTVVGPNIAIYMSGAASQAGERMMIGPAGYVSASGNTSVILYGHGTVFENRGTVYGQDGVAINAIAASGHSTLINKGTIEVFNFTAIEHSGNEALTIVNSGSIISPHDAFTEVGGYGNRGTTVVNTGRIIGDFHFAEGNDVFSGSAGRLTGHVFGGAGLDSISGGTDSDWFEGGTENDTLVGNGGNDRLLGQDGNDILNGGAANDILNGGAGNDTLFGDLGKDTSTGGLNNDTFKFTATSQSAVGANADLITDFDDFGNDTIDLAAVYGGTLVYRHNGAFTAAGQVRIHDIAGADVIVEVNTGGSLAADMQIRLTATTLGSMTASDFFL